ncbi:hypothetical protein OWM07_08090 [Deferribacter thermophilus]|uniref:hypothetical protein n=1 Tax=Deferribacter thermophilus TaxID=53573 RepID=UPI003C1DE5C8
MKKIKKQLIFLLVLILLYSLTNSFDKYWNVIQYPFLMFLAFERFKDIEIDSLDILISFFSDFINNLFFGSTLLIFIFYKILYQILKKSINQKMLILFITQVLFVIIFFIILSYFYDEFNLLNIFKFLLLNITFLIVTKIIILRYNFVQSFK